MLLLDDAETQVRALTRHTTDTTRVTQAIVRVWLNASYRRIRTWLQGVAPQLYLLTSDDVTVAEGGSVDIYEDIDSGLERIFRVDQRGDDGSYRPLEVASSADPNVHYSGQPTWREENGFLYFGPDSTFSGTVRVLYYATPADVVDEDEPEDEQFLVPPSCEQPLVLMACGYVALQDGDGAAGKKGWDDLAAALLTEAAPQLRARKGVHQERAGLQRIQGY